jgi:hypothetical protein
MVCCGQQDPVNKVNWSIQIALYHDG